MILQRDNGRKFVTAVISEFKLKLDTSPFLNSGSIERSNQDVSNMSLNWCHENEITKIVLFILALAHSKKMCTNCDSKIGK